MNESLLVPKAEACRRLGVSSRTIEQLIKDGRLKAVVVIKNEKIVRESLNKFLGEYGLC